MKTSFLALVAFALVLPVSACNPTPPKDPAPAPNWVKAVFEPSFLSTCSDSGGNLYAGAAVTATVTSYDNLAANSTNGSKSYSFGAGDDLSPNVSPIELAIMVPDNYAFKIEFTADSPGCQYCGECAASAAACTGNSQLEDHGSEIFNQAVKAGDHFRVSREAFDFTCTCDGACRLGGGGGQSSGGSGGQASGGSGGQPSGGGSGQASGGSAGQSSSDPVCGDNMHIVGEFATWCGKVNVHTTDNGWASDSDCASGCNVNDLSYCQKFWPTASSEVARVTPTSDQKTFQDRGCQSAYPSVGQSQFACCAPNDTGSSGVGTVVPGH